MPVTYTKVEKITDAAAVKQAYKPTHPGLFEVVYAEGDYNSKLIACKAYAKGEIICPVEGTTPGPKRYTSVQTGKDSHIELNSDLVFMNHSCNPTVSLDTDSMIVVAVVDLKEGDNLTFFYPSSEWEMDQPFPCWCGADQCVKNIQGAKFLSQETMNRYFRTKHIQDLLTERDAASA
ncbi:hypothetical protein K457DRAFT_132112 [Linnemannia elongata AG-77]|uniref:SET domain-containing protein n=1 Tax=Linnemannia elongata AG-77 TaxID=1314771 RepID=A0A197KF38_9FUNG|nr:hypothetical protein K457DRAFT_132112 [Linnemannia elongata AG-77]